MKKRYLGWLCLWGFIFVSIAERVEASEEIIPPPYHDMQGKKLSTQACLTINAYHEARGESDAANLAIMAVVEVRARDSRHKATTPCEAVFHPYAFSWTSDGKSDYIYDKQQYQRLYKLAEKFLLNKDLYVEMFEHADHYHVVGLKTKWNYRVLDYISRIDNHVFYRWKK
ncbi:cell wall hydrolase [Vibrio phage 1.121.O._10N.286.46.C4]|nr:cell wall hydrolase [Vibrio phage 1.121.O._10N.286.46.C4]